jgi:hypothetical protein
MTAADARLTWDEETVPVLRVDDAAVAEAWYGRLGFELEWEHRFEPDFPVFASVRRGPEGAGVRLFLSEHRGDANPGAGSVYLRVRDVAPIAAEFGVDIVASDGRLEVHLEDPYGNRIVAGAVSGQGPGPGYTYPASST